MFSHHGLKEWSGEGFWEWEGAGQSGQLSLMLMVNPKPSLILTSSHSAQEVAVTSGSHNPPGDENPTKQHLSSRRRQRNVKLCVAMAPINFSYACPLHGLFDRCYPNALEFDRNCVLKGVSTMLQVCPCITSHQPPVTTKQEHLEIHSKNCTGELQRTHWAVNLLGKHCFYRANLKGNQLY